MPGEMNDSAVMKERIDHEFEAFLSFVASGAHQSREETVAGLGQLLLEMRDALKAQSIFSIHDSRVGHDVRALWDRLLDVEVIAAISDEQLDDLAIFCSPPVNE